MKFVALVSGGKDSCYNVLHCLKQGHTLAAFANLYPADESQQELDSYMFQTVGHDVVSHYENCAGIPLFRQKIASGSSKNLALNYTLTLEDEIEDLFSLLSKVKCAIPDVEAVSVGAILSSYQRIRVEDVCRRLNLTVLSYLWQRNQLELMSEMCSMSKTPNEEGCESSKMDARIIKVAAVGLDQTHLNMSLPQIFPIMKKLNRMYDVHICGEGGEFETMVLDAPFFTKGSLEVVDQSMITSDESYGVYSVQLGVKFKPKSNSGDINEALEKLPVVPLLNDKWTSLLEMVEKFEDQHPVMKDRSETLQKYITPKTSVVKVRNLLYVSNIRGKLTSTSIEDQTREVFSHLKSIMEETGVVSSQALSCSLILNSMSDFTTVNSIYSDFFDISRYGPLPPSRACVESKSLGDSCLVQLSVVFDTKSSVAQLENGTVVYRNKNGLHVQGRSYWAPCNIGPYSQAVWLNSDENRVSSLSGQIPLIPSSMELASKDPVLQGVLSLRHFDTLKTTIDCKNQLFMTCFTTTDSMVPVISHIWSLYCNGMQYESDLWMDKEQDPVECLIVVKVSELPRGALCEWGGVTCQRLLVEHLDEDELTEELSEPMAQMSIVPNGSCKISSLDVSDGGNHSQFITGFADSLQDLRVALDSIILPYKATIYCNPSDVIEDSALEKTLNSAEILPVEAVFDYDGVAHKFGFHIIR